ncbi:something about silencing protein 10 [Erpetoichthys calabaricus]|uniref:something about silencing protein 10 n=1 Tax=Erpetoichthys calabaricus TaxID=27687 RepID=UPI002234AD10|nr:something about silencing protein 10 [Erpetoichthys calabaricus]
MGRVRRPVKRKPQKKEYDSDDSLQGKNVKDPDKKSSQYYQDEVDDFHQSKIEKLMGQGIELDSDQEDLADEEEVMGLELTESEEDEEEEAAEDDNYEEEQSDMESDLEGKKDEDLPNELAWGHRKKTYYDTDYSDSKAKSQEEIAMEEEEEEQEAKSIQNRLVGILSEEDYDLNLLQEFSKEQEGQKEPEKEGKITKDLENMSSKQKMKLLKKESPELVELIQDFKAKLTELKDELEPLLEMVNNGKIPPGEGASYLQMKHQLYLNYCTNISFYLVLKARRTPVHNHPVIERLLAFRNLINKLGAVDAELASQIRQLLSTEPLEKKDKKQKKPAKAANKVTDNEASQVENAEDSGSDLDEDASLHYYKQLEEKLKLKRKRTQAEKEWSEEVNEEQVDENGKRAITYQIAKNKGLTPRRKKIDRNPRVKHREKFRRAKIRRKGQVSEVRREEQRYGGELSGIRAGVKKSIKLK